MKLLFKPILKTYLKYAAKTVIFYNKPVVIAIAGSLNKTFIKDRIESDLVVLGIDARATINNFNTDIGLSLSILGLNSGYNSYVGWWNTIKEVPQRIFNKNFPKVLILEFGISDNGDMKYLTSIARPDITIISEISKRYLENFGSIENMIGEYGYLVKKTKRNGLVILNTDNSQIIKLAKMAQARVETIAVDNNADYKAENWLQNDDGINMSGKNRKGQNCNFESIRHGRHHLYGMLASWIIQDFIGGKNEKN